jgi:hypothetical protein
LPNIGRAQFVTMMSAFHGAEGGPKASAHVADVLGANQR